MDEIYNKYSNLVYNYLYKLTNNHEISEDLTQETFYSAIKGIKHFKYECKIDVWLCQIAKNKWKDYLLKKKKRDIVYLNEEIEYSLIEDDFEEMINSKEDTIELYKQIHKLEKNTREVIFLRIQGEFTFKEIGKIMGKSEEWARVTYYRGKTKIKEELNNGRK